MTTFSYPTSQDVRAIEQARLPLIEANMAGAEILPWTEENVDTVLWEVRDNVQGITFARGVNEPFPLVADLPVNTFYVAPGRFGERKELSEDKIERMRKIGTYGTPIDVSEEMARFQNDLAVREQQLIEFIRWQLLIFGFVNVPRKDGTLHRVASYTVDLYPAPTPFTTVATAAPLAFFESVRNANNGFGFQYDRKAKAFANSNTLSYFKRNANAADLQGIRNASGATIHTLSGVSEAFVNENLPQLIEVDDTYVSSTGVPTRYIPDGYVVLAGWRSDRGVRAGNYVSTRNGNNPDGGPGLYVDTGVRLEAPRLPWTERGHNGAPRMDYVRQVKVLKVY